ncbi:phosphoesterase [Chryseobacterium piperi]|uniref:Phosphoesterase n=1 Tax=Chryseobacterium piperi TaxID=558152 RepID=A0A086AWP5_9FLAO|nr:phosphatase PAP2 family protein [Chryseobacterium piperi]ASW73470.1 phosphatase PAP2 family protein [Chryseobacterium piperi]KFF21109.1 phosphoesterase [Chryseobacterium piperi]
MNKTVINNYNKVSLTLLYLPALLLLSIVFFLYRQDALSIESYVHIQKHCFFFLNSKLSQYPNIQYNLTQFGDALIFLSFLTIFIVYAPKIWEAIVPASLTSALLCSSFKALFTIPRPAAVFDNKTFVIIGKTLSGRNSLPSGHSITIFVVLTILLFAFMPKKLTYKIIWCSAIIIIGLILAFTRVGVGAHYPLDVIIGSILGYIAGVVGIFISQKYNLWTWIKHKNYYLVAILILIVCIIILINKILNENLVIFYLSLMSLITSLYIITRIYVKK